jgi:hypothetical protein
MIKNTMNILISLNNYFHFINNNDNKSKTKKKNNIKSLDLKKS